MGIVSFELGVPSIHVGIIEAGALEQSDPCLLAAPKRSLSKGRLREQRRDRLLPQPETHNFLVEGEQVRLEDVRGFIFRAFEQIPYRG
jgi:hypothetical protein